MILIIDQDIFYNSTEVNAVPKFIEVTQEESVQKTYTISIVNEKQKK